jgi:aspartate-semialdehyde dehydrogenase
MFRQITPNGDVTRTKPVAGSLTAQIDGEDEKPKENMKLEEEDRSIPAKTERRSRMFNLVVSSKI